MKMKRTWKKTVAVFASLSMLVTSIYISPGKVSAGVLSNEQNSSGWNLVWSDEFDQTVGGGVDTGTWTYQTGHGDNGWGNSEVQNYTDSTENVYITNADGATDGKALAIKAKRDYDGGEITSGRLMSEGKFYARYGRMEARIRMENGMQNGVWPAFWMMGNQTGYGWPNCGEIDIMEHRNKESEIISTLHWNPSLTQYQHSYYGSEINGQYGYVSTMDEWHTFRADWYENEIQFFLDGQWYESIDITSGELEEFQRAHYFLLNLAIGSNASPFTKNITVDSDWRSSTMYVDYVRVYQGSDANFQRNKTNRTENLPEPEVTTPVPDGFITCVQDVETNVGQWNYYFGNWAGAKGSYKGGERLDDFSLKVTSKSNAAWGVHANTNELDVEKGSSYRYRININANQNTGAVLLKNDITADNFPNGEDLQTKGIVAGDNVYEGTFTAYADKVKFMLELGSVDAGTILNINSFTLEKITDAPESTQAPPQTDPQTTPSTQPQPDVPDETTTSDSQKQGFDGVDWLLDGARAGALSNTFKAYFESGENCNVVNIQNKDGIAGIYVGLNDANIGDITVNGEKKTEIIEGAGVWVNVDHLTKRENEVIFYNPDGSVKAVLKILNTSIAEGGDGPVNPTQEETEKKPESTPEETSKKEPESPPTETITTAQESLPTETTTTTQDVEQETDPPYQWDFDPSTLNYKTMPCNDKSIDVAEYEVSVSGFVVWYGDDGNTLLFQYSADYGQAIEVLVNGQQAGPGLLTENSPGGIKLNPNQFPDNEYIIIQVTLEEGSFVVVVRKGNPVTPPVETATTKPESTPEETSTKESESSSVETSTTKPESTPAESSTKEQESNSAETSTAEPESNSAEVSTKEPESTPEETSTTEPESIPAEVSTTTQEGNEQTQGAIQTGTQNQNVAATTTTNITQKTTTTDQTSSRLNIFKKSGKSKIKKITKRKSAKKVTIILKKKINGADGYQVRFYKTRKAAKKNKKAVARITYKKNKKKFTVTSKKIKNRKKLFIRVRAYVVIDGKKTYSGWSAVAKVKK